MRERELGLDGREGGVEDMEEREVERVWGEGGGEGVEMSCFMITCRCQSGTKSPRGNRAVRCHDSSVDSALL